MRANQSGIPKGDSKPASTLISDAVQSAGSLPDDLAHLVEAQIDARMDSLGKTLLQRIFAHNRKVVEDAAAGANEQVNQRIEVLERNARAQLRALSNLQQSARTTAQKVDLAVTAIDRTLAPAQTPAPPTNAERERQLRRGTFVCWKCTSTDIRRSAPEGFYDGLLRLFFLAPFRCKKCFYRFYRFSIGV